MERNTRYMKALDFFHRQMCNVQENRAGRRIRVEVLPDKWRWYNTVSSCWWGNKKKMSGTPKMFLNWHARHSKTTNTDK